MMEINDLPAEMLLMVHQRLRPSALKMAVLVNKLWRAVGEDPSLWKWCTVTVYSKEDITNLSIKRLRRIREIIINPKNWDADDWQAFFRAVEGLSSLKKIYGPGLWPKWWGPSGLNLVEPGLFARSLAKLEDVTVRDGISYDRIEALFTEMSRSSGQVKTFHLWGNNLSQMEPALFARVLSRLEYLDFFVYYVTKDQITAFFTELLNNSSMKKLDFMNEDIWSYLEPGLSARALSKIEDVSLTDYLWEDEFSCAHLEALFAEPSFGTQLKRLRLNCNLSEIDPALIANSLSRLEELHLQFSVISADQIEALFVEISLRTQMKKLALDGVDLSQLDPGLVGRVMARIEIVLLREESYISNDQVISLFSEMSLNTASIKKIDLNDSDIDLSSFGPEVLVRALIRLEEVRLSKTDITHDQAKAFFTEMSQNTQLKELELDGGDFSGVDPAVLSTAVTKLNKVSLRDCNLNADQVTSILTRVLEEENKLTKIYLSYIGGTVAIVNPEILRKVQDKLKGELKLLTEIGETFTIEFDVMNELAVLLNF